MNEPRHFIFTWKIENWTWFRSDKLDSPVFEVQGIRWQIRILGHDLPSRMGLDLHRDPLWGPARPLAIATHAEIVSNRRGNVSQRIESRIVRHRTKLFTEPVDMSGRRENILIIQVTITDEDQPVPVRLPVSLPPHLEPSADESCSVSGGRGSVRCRPARCTAWTLIRVFRRSLHWDLDDLDLNYPETRSKIRLESSVPDTGSFDLTLIYKKAAPCPRLWFEVSRIVSDYTRSTFATCSVRFTQADGNRIMFVHDEHLFSGGPDEGPWVLRAPILDPSRRLAAFSARDRRNWVRALYNDGWLQIEVELFHSHEGGHRHLLEPPCDDVSVADSVLMSDLWRMRQDGLRKVRQDGLNVDELKPLNQDGLIAEELRRMNLDGLNVDGLNANGLNEDRLRRLNLDGLNTDRLSRMRQDGLNKGKLNVDELRPLNQDGLNGGGLNEDGLSRMSQDTLHADELRRMSQDALKADVFRGMNQDGLNAEGLRQMNQEGLRQMNQEGLRQMNQEGLRQISQAGLNADGLSQMNQDGLNAEGLRHMNQDGLRQMSQAGLNADGLRRTHHDGLNFVSLVSRDGKEILVDRIILCARSPVFLNMLCSDMSESVTGTVRLPDFDSEVLEQMVVFMYGEMPDLTAAVAVRLLWVADKYEMPSLWKLCSAFLVSNLTIESAPDLLELSNLVCDPDLKRIVVEFMSSHLPQLLHTEKWKALLLETDFALEEGLQVMRDIM